MKPSLDRAAPADPSRSSEERFKARLELLLLVFALLVRLAIAFQTIDQQHPDEHFQTLEPAGHAVWGYGWMAWEWSEGIRSWFVPGLYIPIFGVMKLFGSDGGLHAIWAARAWTALASAAAVWGFATLLRKRGLRFEARLGATAAFAFSPMLVVFGAATLSDTWALDAFWIALPFVYDAIAAARMPGRRVFLAGALLGIGFAIRVQTLALIGPAGLYALIAILRSPIAPVRARWKPFLAGALASVLFQGALDWATWGMPFHSTWMNVKRNLLDHVAAQYGVSPWDQYFLEFPRFFPFWLLVFVALTISAAFLFRRAWRAFRPLDLGLVLVPCALFFAAHCALAHKELRFVLPAVPGLLYLFALALEAILADIRARELSFRAFASLAACLVAIQALAYYDATDLRHFDGSNISGFMIEIAENGDLRDDCVLLIFHYWVWSHGDLLQGRRLKLTERYSHNVEWKDLVDCRYAIAAGAGAEQELLEKVPTSGRDWSLVRRDERGYSLYRRD